MFLNLKQSDGCLPWYVRAMPTPEKDKHGCDKKVFRKSSAGEAYEPVPTHLIKHVPFSVSVTQANGEPRTYEYSRPVLVDNPKCPKVDGAMVAWRVAEPWDSSEVVRKPKVASHGHTFATS